LKRVSVGSILQPVEMNVGDECLVNDSVELRVVSTRATIDSSSQPYPEELAKAGREPHLVQPRLLQPRADARMVHRMHVALDNTGVRHELVRFVGSQRSFYEPWRVAGLLLFFDASVRLFDYLHENHGQCRPSADVRLALATDRICPPLLHPWCPLPEPTLRIEDAYAGSDTWLGPYMGSDAHGGLDINHPAGTPIWAPFALDGHELFQSLTAGDGNNRWRGWRTWDDGTRFVIGVHHVAEILPVEHCHIDAGMQIAHAAAVSVGAHEHSHFTFAVQPPKGAVTLLDPWILFWQMYADRSLTRSRS
jgi:hypothetical protein